MAKLADIIAYICRNYKFPNELSKARLAKTIYLCDWNSAFRTGQTISNVSWLFDYYGPYANDVVDTARTTDGLSVRTVLNNHGARKDLVEANENATYVSLGEYEISIIDGILRKTEPLYWSDFMALVYRTYPIKSQERFSILDLPQLAREYKDRIKVAEE